MQNRMPGPIIKIEYLVCDTPHCGRPPTHAVAIDRYHPDRLYCAQHAAAAAAEAIGAVPHPDDDIA